MRFDILHGLHMGYKMAPDRFEKTRPTLVLIHGAGGCAQVWQAQVNPLKRYFNILALDLPGHGETKGSGMDSINEYARWVEKILTQLFSEPVFLMGHSMGGAIVQELALKNKNLLKGIILISTGPKLQVAPKILDGLLNQFEETIEKIIEYAYAPETDDMLKKEGVKLMKSAGSNVLRGDFLACDRFDRRKEIGNIDLPCLVICGKKDVLTPPSLSITLHQAIKQSMLHILPSAGHMVMIESHTLFNAHVQSFVTETMAFFK